MWKFQNRKNLKSQLMLLLCLSIGCGTAVRNPDDDDDSTTASIIPSLDYEMPEIVSGTALLEAPNENQKQTVMYMWANRMERIVQDINDNLERLKNDNVNGTGEFTGKGPDGLISGTIIDSDEDDYDYEATICLSDEAFYQMKWNSDGSSVYMIRDFSVSPINSDNKNTMISEVFYEETDDATTVTLYNDGKPWRAPPDVDGENLVESMIGAKGSDGTFHFTGVNDWYDTEFTGEGDSYLVGTFDEEGDGEFLAYRSFGGGTCLDFDEDDLDNPRWCLGRSIGTDTAYDDGDRVDAWDRLSGLTVRKKANLKELELSDSLTCP